MNISIGPENSTLVREASSAFGPALEASPDTIPQTIFWFGQMISHTFRNISVPSSAPMVMSKVQPVVGCPRSSRITTPVRKVNIAPQRNQNSARGASFLVASALASGVASLKYSPCTKLK